MTDEIFFKEWNKNMYYISRFTKLNKDQVKLRIL